MSILRTEGIIKDYPGTRALDDVTVSFNSGKVHAFIGKNGSGKSTLVKVFAGAIQPTGMDFSAVKGIAFQYTGGSTEQGNRHCISGAESGSPSLSGGKYIFGTSSEEGTSGRLEEDVSDGRRAATCNGRRY